jgi:hypothetical protein
MCEPKPDAAVLWFNTPVSGNNAKGINEVAGIGNASVAHHQAVSNVIAAVALAVELTPLIVIAKNKKIAKQGPKNKCL